MCGGTSMLTCKSTASKGLSPRVRGNPFQSDRSDCRCGSIPACAGEPPQRGGYVSQTGVYPRVCGGTVVIDIGDDQERGLSPRVRGNLNPLFHESLDARSIPACAGEPSKNCLESPRLPVYPRVCGGTPPDTSVAGPPGGLSPRVRGNQEEKVEEMGEEGSIPACAGEPLPHYF